jgi:type I restriction enzyme, S subunit
MSPQIKLPKGWSKSRIGDVVEDRIEQGLPEGAREFIYVDISAVDNQLKEIVTPKTIAATKAPSRARQRIRKGDVLVSTTRPNLNAVALVPPSLDGAVASTGFAVLRPILMDPRWVFSVVQSDDFANAMTALVKGALYPAVRPRDIHDYVMPVPPLAEQKRTTGKLSRLLKRLVKLRTALNELPELIRQYRASVLEAAFTGRLVPIEAELAREQHRDFEPASALLERILHDRRAKWEAEQLAKMRAARKAPKNDDWKAAYREPTAPNPSDSPRLPAGWVRSSLGQCFEVYVGGTPSRKQPTYWNGTIPWVSSGEVQFCHIRNTKEKITKAGFHSSNTRLHPPGTVLLGMVGEGKTRGQAAILEIKATHNQNSAAIGVPATPVPPSWVFYWLWFQYQETRGAGAGNSQPALNKQKVEALPLNLPPLAEQRRILAEVELRLRTLANVEKQVIAALDETLRLRASLFHRALSGKLVSQSPKDEPAERLLQRNAAAKKDRATDQKKAESHRMKKPKPSPTAQFADQLLATVDKQFGNNPFTFEQLAEHISADYESVKVEIFNLLASKKAPRLKQMFNQREGQMELQQVKS